ncbi:MAG: hypothetical protein WBV37_15040 [Nocardioidaceae bacterium]
MRTTRALIGLAGILLAAVGVMKLVDRGVDNLTHTAVWLIAGVIAHDGLLAPVAVVLGVVTVRAVPQWARMPVVGGFVVLGSATIMAIPVLGRFGARADNPSLLDRNYTAGWLVLAALVAAGVAAASWWNRRQLLRVDEHLMPVPPHGHTGDDADLPTVTRTGGP